jgi:hypothetical protein
MLHRLLIVAELRQPQTDEQWAQYEPTGRACVVCPCGLNTGFIDKTEAAQQYRDHARANQPPSPVHIHPDTGEARDVLHDMLGEITKD